MARSKGDIENVDLNVERLAESLWAFEQSDNIESIEDQDAVFRASRPEFLQKARLLMIKIENRGGYISF